MKFFLIDGSGFLYRAYYGLPPLYTNDWKNVNVVYWFFRMLFKTFQEKPDHLVITRDAPKKTVRHEMYAEYKANRKKMEDDFKQQIPLTKQIVEELWIPNITVEWYEADDIIATLARKYKSIEGMKIDIYSADKDLKQLIESNVYTTDQMRAITTNFDRFVLEFDFEPKYILDYLSLIWDASDNVKGVAWIWPKKASTLIIKYKTIENIYDHIEEITWDVKQKLLDGKESAFQSKELITLLNVEEAENTTIEDFKLSPEFDKYRDILIKQYSFNSLEKSIKELQKKYETPTQESLF